jgi:hypothetical protein
VRRLPAIAGGVTREALLILANPPSDDPSSFIVEEEDSDFVSRLAMLSVEVNFFGLASGVSVGGVTVAPAPIGFTGCCLEAPPPLGVAVSVSRSGVGLAGLSEGVPELLNLGGLVDDASSSQFRNDWQSTLPSTKAGSAGSLLPFEMTARRQAWVYMPQDLF